MNFRSIMESLKDPKKKSLILFGLYFIFFVFVYIVLNSNDSVPYDVVDETYKSNLNVDSYEYIYKITNNQTTSYIEGTYNKGEETFSIDGINYYKKDDKIYINDEEVTTIDENINYTNYYRYSNIEKLLENANIINEITYNDESKKITYQFTIDKYFDIMNIEYSCDVINCEAVSSVTIESSEYMNNILIDLQNFYGYQYNIDISYININKIKELKASSD